MAFRQTFGKDLEIKSQLCQNFHQRKWIFDRLVTLLCWSFPKLKVKACTLSSNVGKATSIQQFLEGRLPIKKCHNKTLIKWCKNTQQRHILSGFTESVFDSGKKCFLIVDDLFVYAQFRVVFNVQPSKVSKGTCIDCTK